MPLITTAQSVNQYRLVADFQITGPESVSVPAVDHLGESVLQLELDAGDYLFSIEAGWSLQLLADGTWEAVEAVLQSPDPAPFSIIDQQVTNLILSFLVDDEIVNFGDGILNVSLDVTEGTDSNGGSGEGIYAFVENPGSDCAIGPMPSVDSLTANSQLPDPFTRMDGTVLTEKSEWLCRREEILQQSYAFIYGEKPQPPQSAVSGSVTNSSISVQVSDQGASISFDVSVYLPSAGTAPYPAMIGFGGSIGFASELASRGIATINFEPGLLGAEGSSSGPKSGAFYDIYGSNHEAGLLVAWSWGISRILDVLEQDPSVIDPTRVGVTGCSRYGKGAFVAGVLDNRIALTIPIECGIGGTPALRLVEILDPDGERPYHAISYERWLSAERLGPFTTANNAAVDNTSRLPIDMHEMIGLVAPRGLYIVDNPVENFAALDRNSAWVTANVGARIYEALGVPDNITLQGASGSHCQWRSAYTPALVANLEKFLLGNDAAITGTFATDFSAPDPELHYDWLVPSLTGDL